jgi:hypothetical protein
MVIMIREVRLDMGLKFEHRDGWSVYSSPELVEEGWKLTSISLVLRGIVM